MKIASTISRYLFGLMFVVFGLNGFLWFFSPPPGLTGPIVQWNDAVMTSHFVWLYSGVQVIVGILLLLNRYMALALVAGAAVILNIIVLHITMFPAGLPPAILVAILWFLTAWPHRAYFKPLFAQKID
jgi:hypothetical protein